ncbi:MAG TPA: HI0074 family nucleotidyltransferase substrate-binding subunit [Candidatus Babeliales bacterium]|nr:HI0074 family nucleotidyltransferase substrate-binding subunit [Candidatus Babeliales bacterium]
MEIITLRYKALQKALLSLHNGLHTFKEHQQKEHQEEYFMMRDGLIQRFEYCIDTFWKFIKLYLEEIQKVSMESTTPREILKKALNGIITPEEHTILTKALADRNLTSHSYNEELAIKIQNHIPAYSTVMKSIIDRIKIN